MNKISQREARALKKRVAALLAVEADRRSAWGSDYPGGVHLGTITRADDWLGGAIQAARKLKNAVVVAISDDLTKVRFYALPLANEVKV
jgi:hypothetical protein